MLIRCTNCDTTYVLPNSLMPAGGAAVQCTRCAHTFWASPPPYGSVPVTAGDVEPSSDLPHRNVMMEFGSEAMNGKPKRIIELVESPPEAPVRLAADPMLDSLYEQVWARPDDDAPRHVLADYLSERGDPRGEFIEIQLAEPDGPTGLARGRARELERLIWEWLPAGVGTWNPVFRRGFLTGCLWNGPTDAGHREWRTVERLDCGGAPVAGFFTNGELPVLKELHHVPPGSFVALADGRVRDRLEVLRTLRVPLDVFEERAHLVDHLPALHTLDLEETAVDLPGLAAICEVLARRDTLSQVRSRLRYLCLDIPCDPREGLRITEVLALVSQRAPALTVRLQEGRVGPWLELDRDGLRVCRRAGDTEVLGPRHRFHSRIRLLHSRIRGQGLTARDVVVDSSAYPVTHLR